MYTHKSKLINIEKKEIKYTRDSHAGTYVFISFLPSVLVIRLLFRGFCFFVLYLLVLIGAPSLRSEGKRRNDMNIEIHQ